MSVHPKKKDTFPVVLAEVSYFPCLYVFLTGFEGLRAEDVTSVQFVKAQWDNVQIVISGYTNKIWFDLIWWGPASLGPRWEKPGLPMWVLVRAHVKPPDKLTGTQLGDPDWAISNPYGPRMGLLIGSEMLTQSYHVIYVYLFIYWVRFTFMQYTMSNTACMTDFVLFLRCCLMFRIIHNVGIININANSANPCHFWAA